MRRLQIALLFVLGVISGAAGSVWFFHQAPLQTDRPAVEAIVADALAKEPRPAPGVDPTQEKSIVSEMLAAEDARLKQNSAKTVASHDTLALDPMIEIYLTIIPKILQRMSDALDQQN